MFEIMNENIHSMVLESRVHKASRYNWVMADVIYTVSLSAARIFNTFIASLLWLLNLRLNSEVYVQQPAHATFRI
jgi:hypothetical protein